MDFYEAEQRFQWLEGQRAGGRLNDAQYRAELNQLRVTDQWGRLWMLQERTGQWHVLHNGQWMAAQPPRAAPQQPPPPPQAPPQPRPSSKPSARRPEPQPEKEGGGCGKIALYLVLWAGFWAIVAVAVFIFVGQDEPMALAGVGGAALLSLILLIASISSAWEGTITEIRNERVRVDSGDDWHWETVRFAYVRRTNGKTKKMRAMPQWQAGDRLVKRRGDASVKHYPRQ